MRRFISRKTFCEVREDSLVAGSVPGADESGTMVENLADVDWAETRGT